MFLQKHVSSMFESSLVSIHLSNVTAANIDMRFIRVGMDVFLDCCAMFWQTCSLTLRVFQAGQHVYLFGPVKLLSLVVAMYLHCLAMTAAMCAVLVCVDPPLRLNILFQRASSLSLYIPAFLYSQTMSWSPHLPHPQLFEWSLCQNSTHTHRASY